MLIDLSLIHRITDGMVTYPGLPAPVIGTHLSRGIDSLNIDSTATGQRPVHSILLKAGIPIVEHLTNLAELPPHGFEFTAVPPKIEGAGTFTVRTFAAT